MLFLIAAPHRLNHFIRTNCTWVSWKQIVRVHGAAKTDFVNRLSTYNNFTDGTNWNAAKFH